MNLHTQPNNIQYNAAMIGKGTEAKNAPNFPVSRGNNKYQT